MYSLAQEDLEAARATILRLRKLLLRHDATIERYQTALLHYAEQGCGVAQEALTPSDCAASLCDMRACEEPAIRELRDDWGPLGAYCAACAAGIVDGSKLPSTIRDLADQDERADAERAQERADHLRELVAEREMVQAQTPVVNVEEEAPNVAEPCGCKIVHEPDDGRTGAPPGLHAHGGQQYHLAIEHCPKHEAADDMLTALEALVQHPLKHVTDRDGSWSAIRDAEMIRAQHAVAAAGGSVHTDLSGLGDDDCQQYVEEEDELFPVFPEDLR